MNQQVLNVRMINNDVLGSADDTAGTPTVIGLLKQTYNKLSNATGNTNLNLTVLQNRVTTLENTVNGSQITEPPIEGLTTKITGINTRISGIASTISDINSDISEINSNISSNFSAINSDITALQSRATSIEEINQQQTVKINDNEDDISALTNRVDAIDNSNDGRLTVVENSVTNLINEVEGQGGALDDIIQLQADVDILQQTVNNLPPGGVGQSTNQTGGERFNLYEANRNAASGDYSHAEGYLTNASGSYTHAEGSSTSASAESAHAEGSLTTASGRFSHAEGYQTTAQGNFSHVEGQGGRATNSYSHVEGYYSLASGEYSHAEGYRSQATGTGSHAEGGAYNDSTSYGARGSYAHVEGYSCLASGYCSHAEGDHCNAAVSGAHAEGYYTSAAGQYSHAAGYMTFADSHSLTAVGKFNTYQSGLASVNRRMFVVGNGTDSSHKSNAFVVNYDGSVIINSTQSGTTPSLTIGPNSKEITGTTAASSSTEPDDSIIITKYYFHNNISQLQYVTINMHLRERNNDNTVDQTVSWFTFHGTMQSCGENKVLLNGIALNDSNASFTQNYQLYFDSQVTINSNSYYLYESDTNLPLIGSFILNIPVSQIIMGYFKHTYINNTPVFSTIDLWQRNTPYTLTFNNTSSINTVWFEIHNLHVIMRPV